MKRFMYVLMALCVVASLATPAFADDGRGDHLCFSGDTLVRTGETPNSVVLFGCGARIQKDVQVRRDVVSFGGDVILEEGTRVGNTVVVFGGDVEIAGEVGNEIVAFGGRVTLQPTAVVNGNLISFGGTVDKKEGAVVRGEISRNRGTVFPSARVSPLVPPVPPVPPFPLSFRTSDGGLGNFIGGFFRNLIITLGLIALGALIVVFMPNQLKQVGEVAQASAMPSLGVGCLTWLVVPPLMILFVLTCLGIPLSLILGIAFVAAGMLGWIAIGMILGDRLLNALKVKNIVPILAMAAGLLAVWLIVSIPFLGGLIWLFVSALAIGAVVLTRFGTRAYPPVTTAILAQSDSPSASDAAPTI